MDDWASVTRASHTPTCEQRHAAPPLAARLGRAPPSAAAAAASSARDAARTQGAGEARHRGHPARRPRLSSTLALRGAARRGARPPALPWATCDTGPAASLSSPRTCRRRRAPQRPAPGGGRRAAVPGGGGGAARRVRRVGVHGPSLVTREGGPASEGSQRKRVQNTATHTHTDYEPELCAIV